jgi:transposase InsO family protein
MLTYCALLSITVMARVLSVSRSGYCTTDITYIQTTEGWLHLAVIKDLYSQKIVDCMRLGVTGKVFAQAGHKPQG